MKLLTALLIAVMGFGIAAFGVVRGLSSTGPAQGIRHIITLAQPGDVALAQQALRDRLGPEARVLATGDGLVAETAEDATALIERVAHVELRDAEHPDVSLDGHALTRITADDQGVTIEAAAPLPFHVHSEVTFALDGKIHLAATPDHVDGATMHVPMASMRQSDDLRAMLVAGAAPPLHVASKQPFTRPTGFFPRAWPFLAIGAVLLAVGAVLALRKR